jgi:DNA-binding NtrC family response regulator
LDGKIGTALASAPTWVEVKRAKAMHESEWREPVVVLPLTGFSQPKPRVGEETDTFFVDESWLKLESTQSRQLREGLSLSDREVEIIEAALADCNGRIDGPSGAAAKLGIPRSTLESKIRRFGINKYALKGQTS